MTGEGRDNIDWSKDLYHYNENSLGHIFFKHYIEEGKMRVLGEILDDIRNKSTYTIIGPDDLTDDEIQYIKFLNKSYNYIRNHRLSIQEKNEEVGLMRMEDHNTFMKYIEDFSLKNKENADCDSQLKKIICELWKILDDIDSYADMCIGTSEDANKKFAKIEDMTKRRHDLVKTDGYDLFLDGQKINDDSE